MIDVFLHGARESDTALHANSVDNALNLICLTTFNHQSVKKSDKSSGNFRSNHSEQGGYVWIIAFADEYDLNSEAVCQLKRPYGNKCQDNKVKDTEKEFKKLLFPR